MENKSGRSSRVSNRSTSSSRISRPGSAMDLILERIENLGALHAGTKDSIEAIHADIGAVHADIGAIHADLQGNIGAVQANMGVIHADLQGNIGAVGAAQVETREVLETVIHRLERLEASPVPKFVAGLDLNPSLSNEMTAAPTHSPISLEVKQGNPEVSTAPVVLRRSERLQQHANPSAFETVPATLVERGRNVTRHP